MAYTLATIATILYSSACTTYQTKENVPANEMSTTTQTLKPSWKQPSTAQQLEGDFWRSQTSQNNTYIVGLQLIVCDPIGITYAVATAVQQLWLKSGGNSDNLKPGIRCSKSLLGSIQQTWSAKTATPRYLHWQPNNDRDTVAVAWLQESFDNNRNHNKFYCVRGDSAGDQSIIFSLCPTSEEQTADATLPKIA